ncbi:MAG: Ig-like domain-containing protein [Phycisphaerales bacterium]|nr:Ig-like domain-containing protein [Phycisphaerales bacterium]
MTVQLDASGNASITANDVDNGSNDACGLASLNVSPNSFTCANVGNNTVTLTVTDNNGNTSTCTATVMVEDNVAPTAVCQDITVPLDATGNASITANDVDNGSNDACGLASLNVSPNSFTCANVGGNMVTLTATDNNGNTSTCMANVMITNQDPVISGNMSLAVNKNSTCPAASNELTLTATDDGNVALLQWSIDTAPATGTVTIDGGAMSTGGSVTICYQPDADQIAADSFTIVVGDQCSGMATHTINVTVDNQVPVITGDTTLTVDKNSTCPAASNELTLTATDDANVALLQWSIRTAPATGTVTIDGGATSTGGTVTICYEPTADQGAADSYVILVDDQCGGMKTHTVNVTVNNQAPGILGDTTLTVAKNSTCPAASNELVLNATDDASLALLQWSIQTAPATGVVTIDGGATSTGGMVTICYQPNTDQGAADRFTILVDDQCGGTATHTVNVTVDNANPVINGNTTLTVAKGSTCPNAANEVTLTATDDASLALLQWSIDTAPATGMVTIDGGTMSTGGMVTVCYEPNPNQGAADSFTILVDDQCGGTVTHTVNVTVTNQDPIITQGDGPLNLTVDAGSACPGAANQVALDADDPDADNAIMTWSITVAPMSGTVTFDGGIDAGPNVTVCYEPNANQNAADSFTVTVDDNCGGTDQIQIIVTVQDIVNPTITCPPDGTVVLGQSTDPADVGTATAMDDLDPNPAVTFNDVVAAANCPQAQTITRTWTATDAGGNTATCTQTIIVNDADSDGDGEPDCSDGCPNDANKVAPGDCGCGQADLDEDGNGVSDCLDEPVGQEPPPEQDLPVCVPFLFQSLFGIPLCGPCLLHGLFVTFLSLVGMRRWNRRRMARRNRVI